MAPCLADPSLRCAALALEGDDGPGPSGEIGRDGAPPGLAHLDTIAIATMGSAGYS